MKATLKKTLLAALLTGACLPATIFCDVPNVDIVVRHDEDDWDDWFEEIIFVDRYDYRYDCCDGWLHLDWFDWW